MQRHEFKKKRVSLISSVLLASAISVLFFLIWSVVSREEVISTPLLVSALWVVTFSLLLAQDIIMTHLVHRGDRPLVILDSSGIWLFHDDDSPVSWGSIRIADKVGERIYLYLKPGIQYNGHDTIRLPTLYIEKSDELYSLILKGIKNEAL